MPECQLPHSPVPLVQPDFCCIFPELSTVYCRRYWDVLGIVLYVIRVYCCGTVLLSISRVLSRVIYT